MPLVAFCTDIQEFHEGRILDAAYAARFPGAPAIAAFAQEMRSHGWDVVTGDQILAHRGVSTIDLSRVFIVQEENSRIGHKLLERGGIPALIFTGESPLYAREFYGDLLTACRHFEHRVLFTGAHASAGGTGTNHPLLFPAFHADHEQLSIPWPDRRYLIIAAGNKYWRHANIPWPERLRRALGEWRDRKYTSWLRANQLHEERLKFVAHFDARAKLDVYGSGWDRRNHLPATHRKALRNLRPADSSVSYLHKHELLAQYRFTLTMENFVYPGYVTEKIFDALAAGSIPVYLGAPDIEDFVPKGAFIDMREFSDPTALERYLDEMSQEYAADVIEAGRRFLESEQGQRHSFENRGEFLASLVRSVEATR